MKQIPNFPAYSIDEAGTTIENHHRNRMKSTIKISEQLIKGKPTGYMYVTLLTACGEYKAKRIAVHRLVALTYIPNPDNLPEVNHKDMNRGNNHMSNLEWCSHRDNIIQSWNGRKAKRGPDNPLFGRKAALSTKILQSISKKGVLHPRFKGYYVVNHIKYASANEAGKTLKIDSHTIRKRCNKGAQGSDYYFLSKELV